MGKVLGIVLIVTGVIILLNVVIMAIGGLKAMMGIIIPISFNFLPLNQKLQAWVEVPLSMAMDAYLIDVTAFDEEGFIAGGILGFNVTLSSGGPDDSEVATVPVVYIQEDAEIDEIQRYVLRVGPLNYPSIIFWFVAIGSLVGFITAAVHRFKVRGKGTDKEGVAPEPPPTEVVSVITLEDNEKE